MMHPANLVLRFVLEIAGLIALGLWGGSLGAGPVLALGVPFVAAASWATFAVPGDPSRSGKAPVPVSGKVRLSLELGFFTAATVALVRVGLPIPAAGFAVAVAVHHALARDRLRWLLSV